MAMQQNVPPSGYRFIEYAESTTNAIIDLPFGFEPEDKVEVYAAITDLNTDKFLVTPSVWNDYTNRFAMVGGYSRSFTIAFGNVNTSFGGMGVIKDSAFHLWTYQNRIFGLDGEYTHDCSNAAWGSETTNLRLFYGYSTATIGKITYYDHIKADGTKYHIVPIQHKTTGVVEMYDTVSKTIMTRTGTIYPPAD